MDFKAILQQFQGLDPKDIGRWGSAPKWLVLGLIFVLIACLGWFFYLSDKFTELNAIQLEEEKHKKDYTDRLRKAVNLDALKKQKAEVSEYVHLMEKQLPSKAEMDQLLSEINRAGVARGLQFDLFRPGTVRVDAYYAELPIAVKVSGSYHKIAGFAADLSALPRIVTLNNMVLNPITAANTSAGGLALPTGIMNFETTAKTFRYLDLEEIAAQKKIKEGAKK